MNQWSSTRLVLSLFVVRAMYSGWKEWPRISHTLHDSQNHALQGRAPKYISTAYSTLKSRDLRQTDASHYSSRLTLILVVRRLVTHFRELLGSVLRVDVFLRHETALVVDSTNGDPIDTGDYDVAYKNETEG